MKKTAMVLAMVLVVGLTAATAAVAQDEGLTLKLSRDWGYGGFGGEIQGTFSMRVSGPEYLARVEFYIDDLKIGEVTSAPYNLQFVTDNYPLGAHSLHAIGYTADGQELRSRAIDVTFVPASKGTEFIVRTVVPILGIILGAVLVAFIVSMVTGRKLKNLPPGTPRSYPLGGGICPKCGRPSALQFLGLNVLAGKFQRCPYCGRWSIFRRASPAQLRAAEEAELAAAGADVPAPSAEEKLKKELDDSKYVGM